MASISKVLYVGVTGDLPQRIWQHKNEPQGFVKEYKTHRLVYYEVYDDSVAAIEREKNIKKWKREWKERLINEENPKWNDLYKTILQ